MASKQSTVDFILGQIAGAGSLASRRMFGEFAIYCDGKVVGFVCDDELFIKPTPAGRTLLADRLDEAPPYPGAKLYLRVAGEDWDDRESMTELVRATAASLPPPAAKKSKSRQR